MKKALLAVGILIGLVVVAAIVLPFVIDADRFRPLIEERLSAPLGRQVRIGHVALSILKGELKADDVSIAEDPAFGATPFIQAKGLEVGVELMPLIRSRAVNVRTLTFVQPEAVLLQDDSGKWNFSSLGQGSSTNAEAPAVPTVSKPTPLTVAKFEILNGRVTVGGQSRTSRVYDNVNITAQNFSFDSAFPFSLEARTPGGGSLQVSGNAGPLDAKDAGRTPFQAKVTLQQLDLTSTGFLDASSGLAGIVDYDGEVRSSNGTILTNGTATVAKLRVVKTGSAAKQPVSLRYATEYNLAQKAGALTKGEVQTGKSNVALNGTYETSGDSTAVHMNLAAPSIAVEDIEALLPAIGMTLPTGSSLQGGTASADLALDGPLEKLVTSGDVKLSNAKLKGFGLASKLSALAVFTGLKSSADTSIELMSSRLNISPDGIRSEDFKLIVPEIGTIFGAGTIGGNSALDFKLLATLSTTGVGGALTNLASRVGVGGAVARGIPFLVRGTSSSPSFAPDASGMVKRLIPNQQGEGGAITPKSLGDAIGGIFGKKRE